MQTKQQWLQQYLLRNFHPVVCGFSAREAAEVILKGLQQVELDEMSDYYNKEQERNVAV